MITQQIIAYNKHSVTSPVVKATYFWFWKPLGEVATYGVRSVTLLNIELRHLETGNIDIGVPMDEEEVPVDKIVWFDIETADQLVDSEDRRIFTSDLISQFERYEFSCPNDVNIPDPDNGIFSISHSDTPDELNWQKILSGDTERALTQYMFNELDIADFVTLLPDYDQQDDSICNWLSTLKRDVPDFERYLKREFDHLL